MRNMIKSDDEDQQTTAAMFKSEEKPLQKKSVDK